MFVHFEWIRHKKLLLFLNQIVRHIFQERNNQCLRINTINLKKNRYLYYPIFTNGKTTYNSFRSHRKLRSTR